MTTMKVLLCFCLFAGLALAGGSAKVIKEPPAVVPTSPKRALFFIPVDAGTELSQMLMIADELVARGHTTEFICNGSGKDVVEKEDTRW